MRRLSLDKAHADPGYVPNGVATDRLSGSDIPEKISQWPFFGQIMLLLALCISSRPYGGIIHDARLYIAQAINSQNLNQFSSDIFFKYGSQDSYTAFSYLYKPLVLNFGADNAHLFAVITGQALWFAATLYLMRTLFGSGRAFVAAAIAVIVLSSTYGSAGIFSYGERFATPRLFAEGLVLTGLALSLRKRLVSAIACVVGAGALHPLMALAGAGVLAVLAALHDRRVWLVIFGGIIAAFVMIVLGVGPFARGLLQFDDYWFEVIRRRCSFAFLSRWRASDFIQILAVVGILCAVTVVGERAHRRLIQALLVCTAVGLAAAYVGGDFGRNILIVNLQPWRVLWLTTLIANAYAAVIALRLPRGWTSRELFLFGLGASAASRFLYLPDAFASVLFVIALVAMAWELRHGRSLPWQARLAFRLWPAATIWWSVFLLYNLTQTTSSQLIIVRLSIVMFCIVILLTYKYHNVNRIYIILSIISMASAIIIYDNRNMWTRYVENAYIDVNLNEFLGYNKNVYWEQGVELLWIKLRMPSYYSCLQGSGVMFYRRTAREYDRRAKILSGLNSLDFSDDPNDFCATKRDMHVSGPSNIGQLREICLALSDLDTIVLMKQVAGVPSAVWQSPVSRSVILDKKKVYIRKYYKYDCNNLR